MPTLNLVRAPENRRRFDGEEIGERLAEWLNSRRPNDPSLNRIVDIIQSIKELTGYARAQAPEMLAMMWAFPPGPPECARLRKRLNEQLAFYKGGAPSIGKVDGLGRAHFLFRPLQFSKAKPDEWDALDLTMGLSMRALLHRLRKCDYKRCGRWFFAHFDHQMSHDDRCRIGKYRTSESAKQKRREKQREYYRLSKSANVVRGKKQ